MATGFLQESPQRDIWQIIGRFMNQRLDDRVYFFPFSGPAVPGWPFRSIVSGVFLG
jgi:hypothetical protein